MNWGTVMRTAEGPGEHRIRVVVVDDHTTFSDLLAMALAAEPDLECVATATTASEAISLVEALQPDVVVMDVHLGEDDGIDTTATLTARNPQLKVVVLTAHADRQVLNRVSDAGACALVPKALLVKLEAHSQLEAVAIANRRGLIDAVSAG